MPVLLAFVLCLLSAMNDAIASLRESGTLAELSNEFFGMDISQA